MDDSHCPSTFISAWKSNSPDITSNKGNKKTIKRANKSHFSLNYF